MSSCLKLETVSRCNSNNIDYGLFRKLFRANEILILHLKGQHKNDFFCAKIKIFRDEICDINLYYFSPIPYHFYYQPPTPTHLIQKSTISIVYENWQYVSALSLLLC